MHSKTPPLIARGGDQSALLLASVRSFHHGPRTKKHASAHVGMCLEDGETVPILDEPLQRPDALHANATSARNILVYSHRSSIFLASPLALEGPVSCLKYFILYISDKELLPPPT